MHIKIKSFLLEFNTVPFVNNMQKVSTTQKKKKKSLSLFFFYFQRHQHPIQGA